MTQKYTLNAYCTVEGANAADWFRDQSIFRQEFATEAEAEQAVKANYLGPDTDGNHASWSIEEIDAHQS